MAPVIDPLQEKPVPATLLPAPLAIEVQAADADPLLLIGFQGLRSLKVLRNYIE